MLVEGRPQIHCFGVYTQKYADRSHIYIELGYSVSARDNFLESDTPPPSRYYINPTCRMAPPTSDPMVLDTDSASSSQSELSELDSAQYNGIELKRESDTSSSTNPTPTIKKRKLRAPNTWLFSRKPLPSEEEKDSKGRRYWYCN